MKSENLKAPFPWFGGKRPVAPQVWAALGNVPNYIEPFLGSGAVFLARPHPHKIATLNEKNPLVVNFYRAIKYAPEETARYAVWPITESDKHAREIWILERLQDLRGRVEGNPEYYDAKLAGYWVYGISLHIGGGWCSGGGAWVLDDEGRLVKREKTNNNDNRIGLKRRPLPYLSGFGKGIHRKRPHLASAGQGIHRMSLGNEDRLDETNEPVVFNQSRTEALIQYFNELAEKFAVARITCGDWSRVMGPSVWGAATPCGIFLDPPYDQEMRDKDVYNEDTEGISAAVREWCLENGNNPQLRIVLAGYEGEGHEVLEKEGWRVLAWKAQGGYGNLNDNNNNRFKERLWFSPHCIGQGSLFTNNYV